MAETRVGVRDLKARLSGYLQEVKAGRTVVITERGRPVGRIIPVEASLEEKLQTLVDSSFAAWSGRRLNSGRSIAKLKARKKTIADIVIENRG